MINLPEIVESINQSINTFYCIQIITQMKSKS